MRRFHQLKSYLGSVCYLMRDSGLEEIVKLIIYLVEATVQHILKGSNYYYKALRVRFLIVKALADVLNRQLSNEAFVSIRNQGRIPALWIQGLEMAANIFSYIREPATSISILNQREICSHTSLLLDITSTPSVQGSPCNCLMLGVSSVKTWWIKFPERVIIR